MLRRMTQIFDDLAGKTALITGASGGLGKHFAAVLSAHGVRVAIAARRKAQLEAVAAELGTGGRTIVPVELDVTDSASVRAAIDHATQALGPLDILINNSGVSSQGP